MPDESHCVAALSLCINKPQSQVIRLLLVPTADALFFTCVPVLVKSAGPPSSSKLACTLGSGGWLAVRSAGGGEGRGWLSCSRLRSKPLYPSSRCVARFDGKLPSTRRTVSILILSTWSWTRKTPKFERCQQTREMTCEKLKPSLFKAEQTFGLTKGCKFILPC